MRTVAVLFVTLLIGSLVAPAVAGAPAADGSVTDLSTAEGSIADSSTGDTSAAPITSDSVETGATDGVASQSAPPDPDSDAIGWENGYWYNETVDVDQSDGLSESELEAFVARSMARVEFIRKTEFDSTVPVEIVSREEFQNRGNSSGELTRRNRWNDQVWEALFVVGEDQAARDALSAVFGGSVAGFYSPSQDRIVVVSDNTETPTIDNATLVHELVHALQDQQFDLTREAYSGQTQDEGIAVDGLVEGEANYVETRYAQYCAANWSCVATPESSGGGGGQVNLGIFLTIFTPYSDGPVYVQQLLEEGGWEAVDDAWENPPQSSEQIIQGTDEQPTRLTFEDRARNGWSAFPNQGVNGAETVGEASIYSMFWYQARNYGADTIQWRTIGNTQGPYDTYNYDSGPSEGWANDKLVPYVNGDGDDAEYGYVWKTRWDSAEDAREFREAYLAILEAHDVRQRDDGVYVVPSGPWEDAFVVSQDGRTVTVVNGPTPAAVGDIRPNAQSGTDTPTPTATGGGSASDDGGEATPSPTAAGADSEATPTDDADGEQTTVFGPGFGAVVALAALLVAAGLARRR